MTYCEEVGLKVGDKIRYLGDSNEPYFNTPHNNYAHGDVLELLEDDGTDTPQFCSGTTQNDFCLSKRKWEKVTDVSATDNIASAQITKDTIVNMEFTLGELFVIHNLLGLTSGQTCLYYLFEKVGEILPLGDAEDTYDDCNQVIDWDMKDFNRWVDSHFITPAKAKALELRKQAEELIKQAEELEGK